MKRHTLFLALATALILVLVLTAGQAGAGSRVTRVHALETFCTVGSPEEFWYDGNIANGRNQPFSTIVESSDPRFAGTQDLMANWTLNTETSKGFEWGTFDVSVSDISGGWAGTWTGRASMSSVVTADGIPWWLLKGRGTGYGYGSLYGLTEYIVLHASVEVYETFEEADGSAPCVTGETIDGKWFVAQTNITAFLTGHADD